MASKELKYASNMANSTRPFYAYPSATWTDGCSGKSSTSSRANTARSLITLSTFAYCSWVKKMI